MTGAPLVGREREERAARALLDQPTRLLTLWGPPGIGKTRLARALVHDHPDHVWVPLAGTQGLAGLRAAVEPELSSVPQLVVLDNLEHLLDADEAPAVCAQIERWLQAHPTVSLLVTSRRRLRIPEEQALGLGPLAADPCMDLFLWHVRRHRAVPDADDDEREALRRLVQALDGLPLAVELAAARWELLGTEGLLQRLSEPLAVLARPRSEDPRHAALRHAIAWSWDLLSEPDQQALQAVATFAGTFSLEDAEALIGDDALERLESLRDGALVQVPAPGWFELLTSVRAFARERAPDDHASTLAERHVGWCLARHPDPELGTPHPRERNDLEAAARFLVRQADPRAGVALQLLGWAAPGHHLALLDRAIAVRDDPTTRRARGRALRLHGRYDEARVDFEAGLACATTDATRARMLRELGVLHHSQGDLDAALERYQQALTHARAAQDRRAVAVTVSNLGAIEHDLCRYEQAESHYEEALSGLRAVGDRRAEATVLANQAVLRQEQGQLAAAEGAFRGALALHEAAGDARMQAITNGNLGLLLHESSRLDEALGFHERAWAGFQEIPDAPSQALCLARWGAAQAQQGTIGAARQTLADAQRCAAQSGDRTVESVVDLFTAFVAVQDGHVEEVHRRLEAARAVIRISGDARVAARLLRSQVSAPAATLTYGADHFVPPGGERADLRRHASLARMFAALVAAAAEGQPLTVDVLFEAGWPGERISADSMRNRVHVNLAKLRSLGLRDVLQRGSGGYRLDPDVRLVAG